MLTAHSTIRIIAIVGGGTCCRIMRWTNLKTNQRCFGGRGRLGVKLFAVNSHSPQWHSRTNTAVAALDVLSGCPLSLLWILAGSGIVFRRNTGLVWTPALAVVQRIRRNLEHFTPSQGTFDRLTISIELSMAELRKTWRINNRERTVHESWSTIALPLYISAAIESSIDIVWIIFTDDSWRQSISALFHEIHTLPSTPTTRCRCAIHASRISHLLSRGATETMVDGNIHIDRDFEPAFESNAEFPNVPSVCAGWPQFIQNLSDHLALIQNLSVHNLAGKTIDFAMDLNWHRFA